MMHNWWYYPIAALAFFVMNFSYRAYLQALYNKKPESRTFNLRFSYAMESNTTVMFAIMLMSVLWPFLPIFAVIGLLVFFSIPMLSRLQNSLISFFENRIK